MMKPIALFTCFLIAGLFAPKANAEVIFNGGVADLTLFYESASNTWHTTFRTGATTDAVNNANLFSPGFTGIVGLSAANDYKISSLQMNVNSSKSVLVGSTNYFITSANSSPLSGSGAAFTQDLSIPDLGIRARLRENQLALGNGTNADANQFATYNMNLDLANSTFNGNPLAASGANFALLGWDGNNAPVPLIDSANNVLSTNFGNYAHVHRNFGFSQAGDYGLALNFQGVGGTYDSTASTGSLMLNVTAVPEPASTGLIAIGCGCMFVARRIRKKKANSSNCTVPAIL